MSKVSSASVLRKYIERPGVIVAAGCYDGLSGRLVEQAGFEVAYMTGYGVAASVLGKPDYGFITMNEIVTQAKNIVSTINIPLIADSDTGYGNPLNVMRTVEEYEKAGVAAIHLEDQLFPKRCGHMEGKICIPMEEHCKKIEMAVNTRDEMLIIARTDARAPLGFEEAMKRAKAYREAGADIIFVDAPQSLDEIKEICSSIDAPIMLNVTEGAKTPMLPAKEFEEMGVKIVFYPSATIYAATKGMKGVLKCLKETGSTEAYLDNMETFHTFNAIMGLPELMEIEKYYAPRD